MNARTVQYFKWRHSRFILIPGALSVNIHKPKKVERNSLGANSCANSSTSRTYCKNYLTKLWYKFSYGFHYTYRKKNCQKWNGEMLYRSSPQWHTNKQIIQRKEWHIQFAWSPATTQYTSATYIYNIDIQEIRATQFNFSSFSIWKNTFENYLLMKIYEKK